jgi:hypothetical protein
MHLQIDVQTGDINFAVPSYRIFFLYPRAQLNWEVSMKTSLFITSANYFQVFERGRGLSLYGP